MLRLLLGVLGYAFHCGLLLIKKKVNVKSMHFRLSLKKKKRFVTFAPLEHKPMLFKCSRWNWTDRRTNRYTSSFSRRQWNNRTSCCVVVWLQSFQAAAVSTLFSQIVEERDIFFSSPCYKNASFIMAMLQQRRQNVRLRFLLCCGRTYFVVSCSLFPFYFI